MSEEKPFGYRALKEAGSKAIQDAFSKALTELTGEEYEADINSINFDVSTGSWMEDSVQITLTASRKSSIADDVFGRQYSNYPPASEEPERVTVATCQLCDERGFRFVKSENHPHGIARKCSHDPAIESEIPSVD